MPELHDYVAVIHDDGEVTFPYTDFESKPITVWHREKQHRRDQPEREYIVFKLPAGKHWESILQPSVPHPGRYMVTEVVKRVSRAPDRERLTVRELFTMPLSNRGRESLT